MPSDKTETLPGSVTDLMPESEPCTPLPKHFWGHSVDPTSSICKASQEESIDNSPTSADINVGCRPCHDGGAAAAEKKDKQVPTYPNRESYQQPKSASSFRTEPTPPTPNRQDRRSDKATPPRASKPRNFLTIIKSLSSRRDRLSRPMLIRRPLSATPARTCLRELTRPQLASRDTKKDRCHVGFV